MGQKLQFCNPTWVSFGPILIFFKRTSIRSQCFPTLNWVEILQNSKVNFQNANCSSNFLQFSHNWSHNTKNWLCALISLWNSNPFKVRLHQIGDQSRWSWTFPALVLSYATCQHNPCTIFYHVQDPYEELFNLITKSRDLRRRYTHQSQFSENVTFCGESSDEIFSSAKENLVEELEHDLLPQHMTIMGMVTRMMMFLV